MALSSRFTVSFRKVPFQTRRHFFQIPRRKAAGSNIYHTSILHKLDWAPTSLNKTFGGLPSSRGFNTQTSSMVPEAASKPQDHYDLREFEDYPPSSIQEA
ncbi:hypothetical protein TWF173_007747 [Orbilia oligospora]|nr:hypothetical protein TWF173_007747 [Orbilia oligospora]